jgi:subtilisin
VRGIAPGATICSYRVFPSGAESQASNFDIVNAIDTAVEDGCHLINLSLGGGPDDPATDRAIDHAWHRGVVCIVASGNDFRQPVANPARYGACVAVSAFGRPGACPPETVSICSIELPADPTGKFEVADFSNIGKETDLTGPGVGVVSTVPGGYAAMDGTSMACPAVTGRAAVLLSHDQTGILDMPADSTRALAMRTLIESKAKLMGFGAEFEGHGALTI